MTTRRQLEKADLDRIVSAIERVRAHVRATFEGKHDLADVIRTEPGRAIVREGMPDVYHWLRECRCYDTAHPDPVLCAYGQVAVQRVFLDEDPTRRLAAFAIDLDWGR